MPESLEFVPGLTRAQRDRLGAAGYGDVLSLASASEEDLAKLGEGMPALAGAAQSYLSGPAYIRMKNGKKVNIDMSKFAGLPPKEFEKKISEGIQIAINTLGSEVIEKQIPGYGRNEAPTVRPKYIGLKKTGPFLNFGIQEGDPVDQRTFQGAADITGEVAGGFAELLPIPGGKVVKGGNKALNVARRAMGGPTKAGLGAVAAQKLITDPYQRMHTNSAGLPVEPADKNELGVFATAFGGEAIGRAPFAFKRYARRAMSGWADNPTTRENYKILQDLGIEGPRLDQIVTDAGAMFSHESLYEWAKRSPLSANIMKEAAQKSQQELQQAFLQRWAVRTSEQSITPDVVMAGREFAKGVQKYEKGWREVGHVLYKNFFDKMKANSPTVTMDVPWDATKKFLEDRASLDPILASITPQKLHKLHAALNDAYVTNLGKSLPDGTVGSLEYVNKMPFEQMKALRTRVGELIGQFEPNADLPKDQLKKLYGALTEDMTEAAKRFGAEKEFAAANKHWSSHLELQEQVLDNISQKTTNQDMGAAIQSLIQSNDYESVSTIKKALGANSPEWDMVRNFAVREMGMDKGHFNIGRFVGKIENLSDGSKTAILGRGEAREAVENYVKAFNKFGSDIAGTKTNVFNRFGPQQLLGPGAIAGGAGIGYAQSGGDPWEAAKYGALTGAMTLMAPRKIAKMLTNKESVDAMVFALEAQTKERFSGALARLANQIMVDGSPDEQIAVTEFMHNIAGMIPGQKELQQEKPPGGNLGVMGGQ